MTTAIERLEDLTDRVYGRGSAVSLDHERDGWHVRLWDARGMLMAESDVPDRRKDEAVRAMLRRLQAHIRAGQTASALAPDV